MLSVVRQQAITWANVDPGLCRYLASLGHNELTEAMLIYHQLEPEEQWNFNQNNAIFIQENSVRKVFCKISAIICSCLQPYVIFIARELSSLPGGGLNIKMSSYQYRDSHVKDKTVSRPSYLLHGNPHTLERRSLYWDGAQDFQELLTIKHEHFPIIMQILT